MNMEGLKSLTSKSALSALALALLTALALNVTAFAHCQVPCGIYDDEMRFKMMHEHITTMEKAMNEIIELSAETPVNYNQIVRWVNNKEKHAEEFSKIVSYYFLAQRIKAPKDDAGRPAYLHKLELLHKLTVEAMKCKQTTDLSHINALHETLEEFHTAYFAK